MKVTETGETAVGTEIETGTEGTADGHAAGTVGVQVVVTVVIAPGIMIGGKGERTNYSVNSHKDHQYLVCRYILIINSYTFYSLMCFYCSFFFTDTDGHIAEILNAGDIGRRMAIIRWVCSS